MLKVELEQRVDDLERVLSDIDEELASGDPDLGGVRDLIAEIFDEPEPEE